MCVSCLVLPRRPYPSPLLREFLRSFKTLKSPAEHCRILQRLLQFWEVFLKNTSAGVTWQWKNLSFYLYFLKQVSGLYKEKLEKVIQRAQKSDTKDPEEKYACVWLYVYDVSFTALAVFTFSLLKASCLIFRFLGLVVLEVFKKQDSSINLGNYLINNNV